jgi:hypothetical protein
MVVGLEDRCPGGVNIRHQLMALRVSSIGMVAPGKLKISPAELPSKARMRRVIEAAGFNSLYLAMLGIKFLSRQLLSI